jgi:hypothetical protein
LGFGKDKKAAHFPEYFRLNPALNCFPLPLHLYQPSPVQFLQMVGEGRGDDIQPFTQIANTYACHFIGIAYGARDATRHQSFEQGQTMRIAQGLEPSSVQIMLDMTRHIEY